MKKKFWIWTIIVILLVSNFTVVSYLFKENYTYSNSDGSFTISEDGGGNAAYEMIQTRYQRFLTQHPEKKNKQLYRTFTIKPWRFWQWSDWLFCRERFGLPYLDRESTN